MIKLLSILLLVGMGFTQEMAASKGKEQDPNYVDPKPRVGFKFSLGTVATLGEDAIQEAGFVFSPTVLATMNFNPSLYMTGEMTMTQASMPYTVSSDLSLTSIDPTLLFGYRLAGSISIYAGPQLSLLMAAAKVTDGAEEDISDDVDSPAFGAVIGTRTNYSDEFFSDAQFQYGFTDLIQGKNVTNYSLRLGVGLYI